MLGLASVVDRSAIASPDRYVQASCLHHIVAVPSRPCMRTDA